jgi:hypothetical protein
MTLMKKGEKALKNYLSLDTRIKIFMEGNRLSTTSSSKGIDFLEAKMHLPEMRLPAFDRNIEHWSAFYNTFTSTMNKYHYLTPIQKFHYLRTALTGEAAACVNSLSFNVENYPKAMDLLKQRYDCPQVIVSCHDIATIDYPKLTKCSPTIL